MQAAWDEIPLNGAELGGLRLRLATEADFPGILEMVLDPSTRVGTGETPEYAEETLRRLWHEEPETSGLRHFLVERGNRADVIAYLRLEYPLFEPECLWMTFLVVAAGMRGQGYGRRIMELLKAEARNSGCVRKFGVHTSASNAPATRLYESSGFKCIKREPWQSTTGDRSERLTFCCTLTAAPDGAG